MFRLHYNLEKNSIALVVGIIAVASIGGLIEIAPLFTIGSTVEKLDDMRVHTPLEVAGRSIYMREGCYACHSQMIRSLGDEVDRYGPYSLAAESQYDHPMLWGSKRTGPDLARIGGKYSDAWHATHLINPRTVVASSIMPAYPWLARQTLDTAELPAHLATLRRLGVPYTDAMVANAAADAFGQANPEDARSGDVEKRYGKATNIRSFDGKAGLPTEMDALVAYLQSLGKMTTAPYARKVAGGTDAAKP